MADYCAKADVKASTPDTSWGTSYDTLLDRLCTMASRAVDHITKRPDNSYLVESNTTRYYKGDGRTLYLPIDEMAAAPTVEVSYSGLLNDYVAFTTFDPDPVNFAVLGIPFTGLQIYLPLDAAATTNLYWPPFRNSIKITGRFGYSTSVPAEVKQAAIIIALKSFKRFEEAYAGRGANMDLGQLVYSQSMDLEVTAALERITRTTI